MTSVTRPYTRTYPRLSKSYAEIDKANSAIRQERYHGRMLPASAYLCVNCERQAKEYHHPSYDPDDHLCVVPLCRSCHQRHHKAGLELPPLGIVVRPIGILRIAIAGLNS